MASSSTIYKAELSISDMDRHYYTTHALTLARHPSETEQRMMARLLAFMLYADERLEFGRGLSDENEPALWRKAYTEEIEYWIEVGQPDEARIRKACGRADQVVVINYGGRSADIWWDKVANALGRNRNLTVLTVDEADMQQLTGLCDRNMRLQCLIQDGELQIIADDTALAIRPHTRMGEYAVA
ncbi:MAG TPA: YaeQ family protein [Rhodanobacteraceae bacterium]|nr:YaeQ family protein [Rhodanobacteraceae bacterium]